MENKQKENQLGSKQQESKQAKTSKASGMKSYARYSGIAFQLGATIALCAFAGQQLDKWLSLQQPLMTALLAFLGTVGGIYMLVKNLLK